MAMFVCGLDSKTDNQQQCHAVMGIVILGIVIVMVIDLMVIVGSVIVMGIGVVGAAVVVNCCYRHYGYYQFLLSLPSWPLSEHSAKATI